MKQQCVHLGWFHLLHPESKCWPRQDLYPAGIIYILCLSCTFCMMCPEQRKPTFSSLDFELLLPQVWIETTANTAQELKSFPCLTSIFSFVCLFSKCNCLKLFLTFLWQPFGESGEGLLIKCLEPHKRKWAVKAVDCHCSSG